MTTAYKLDRNSDIDWDSYRALAIRNGWTWTEDIHVWTDHDIERHGGIRAFADSLQEYYHASLSSPVIVTLYKPGWEDHVGDEEYSTTIVLVGEDLV